MQEKSSAMEMAVGVGSDDVPDSLAGRIDALRVRIDAGAQTRRSRPRGELRSSALRRGIRATRFSRRSRAGLTDIAENYVQEARAKYGELPARPQAFYRPRADE